MKSGKSVLRFFFVLFSIISGAQAQTYSINPRATFLLTSNDSAPGSVPFSLSVLGLASGDTIELIQLGNFAYSTYGADNHTGMLGLFSSSSTLLGSDLLNRVPGAIDAGVDIVTGPTFWNTMATDISQDFEILGTGTTVTVPTGAAYLFVAALDSLYSDNHDPNNNFAVSIASTPVIPEPATYAMLLAGLAVLGFSARRWKQKIA